MKKKSASRSAFFNVRVLIGVCLLLLGVFLALAGLGTFTAVTANSAPALRKNTKIINIPGLPPGFDCATIHEKGIDRMEGLKWGLLMLNCGEGRGGTPKGAPTSAFSRLVQKLLPPSLAPLTYGATDVNLVTTTVDTFPNTTQSETFTTANPDNPDEVMVAFNDSRGANFSNFSGASISTDGGTTFNRLTDPARNNQSPFALTFGDPVVLYNKPTGGWFTVWLDGNGSCTLGGYTSTTPSDPSAASWTHFCVHANGGDDRESGWADNNPSSPHFGNMYVSWNDFAVGAGALVVSRSTDNGVTWSSEITVANTGIFIRNVQITGDVTNGDLYIAGMDEGGGGFPHNDTNLIFKSTDGGATWQNTYTGPSFPAPGVVVCDVNPYFTCMFTDNGGYWRHEGWGEPAAFNGIVHLVYAQHGTGADPGDVYYIRSTDGGFTFGTPVKLNSDSTTRPQWQPNLSVSPAGTLLAVWYDARESSSCTEGDPAVPCYRMWANKSNDGGASWQGDMEFSDEVTSLPAEQDPNIFSNYAGDYDYGSALLTKHMSSWDDGRNVINGQSQQDAFTDRELVGFAVTTSSPSCNSVINTQPTDFVINLSDAVNEGTVDPTDFTVNGIPSDLAPTFANGDTQITFHYTTSPVTTEGPQTMNIPANSFTRQSDGQGNFEFNCSFCFAVTPLQVTTTNPPVGGTFSPPAPGDYQYDVNFNQPIDPGSVATSDLTLTGNVGGSVTAVSVNGSTATFTVHFNFGGSVTASIGAGAITAVGCNPNAAFTGNYTVEGCPPQNHYDIAQIGGSIVPGSTDSGNHGDDQVTTIAVPFSYSLYDQTFNAVNVSSNGNAQFTTTDTAFTNQCLPWTTHDYTVFPYWDDQRTDAQSGCSAFPGGTCGIFTSVTGSAPNRIFNIEWRTVYFADPTQTANHELRLYEGQTRFDVVWGNVAFGNSSATGGVQRDDTAFDQYFCDGSGGAATGGQSYILQTCGTPTPTPTASPSVTPTPTPTASPSVTPTPTATATATPTATARPTPTPRRAPTPRPRPTPPPRP
jgi:hypothetical protein